MIWILLALHVIAVPSIGFVSNRSGRLGLLVGVIPTGAAAIWGATQIGRANPNEASAVWVEGLDLSFAFRIDAMAALMTLLVAGIGAAVFVYASGYFSATSAGLGRFGATLMAFTTSMLGLVWSDSVWSLFVFWELTSITSFLLVGHKNVDPAVRAAARRALVITVSGGLALLAGFVVLVDATGTARLSEMSGVAVSGGSATAAAVLIVLAAATKSAQVPFHVWLPGAMAAPTPVSAYLHSATMVKAGVVLMAVASPILGKVDAWTNVGVAFGAVSMLWGAIGALRHLDAKLILAWGTVSQLGLMVTLLSLGVAKASFAAVSILFAHALFKAALFMIVGEIDVRAGTRNVSELSGLASSMPVAFVGALAAGLSMAGVPPLLGFAAKEAAIEAVIGLDGTQRWVVGAIVVGGSVLTVAYTARFLVLVFGGGGAPTTIGPPRWAMAVPASLLSFAGLAGFVVMGIANDIVRPAAVEVDAKADVYQLLRWPGLTTGLAISLGIVAVGALAGLAVARRPSTVPQSLGADTIDRSLDGVIVLARHVTGRVQHGSLPVYVLTMAATASLATVPFFWSIDTDRLFWWDRPAQAIVAVAIVTVAAATVFVRSRLGAALVLGAVGIGISGLFVLQGAPDLVLTQLLVETVVVVGFVIGLGHLRVEFPVNSTLWRSVRVAVSLMVGAGVAAGLASAASNPSGSPVTADLTEESVAVGGGNNVVNVILTDVRGLDTVGEVLVLAVVAVGIITLARAERADRSAAASQSEPGAVR